MRIGTLMLRGIDFTHHGDHEPDEEASKKILCIFMNVLFE